MLACTSIIPCYPSALICGQKTPRIMLCHVLHCMHTDHKVLQQLHTLSSKLPWVLQSLCMELLSWQSTAFMSTRDWCKRRLSQSSSSSCQTDSRTRMIPACGHQWLNQRMLACKLTLSCLSLWHLPSSSQNVDYSSMDCMPAQTIR